MGLDGLRWAWIRWDSIVAAFWTVCVGTAQDDDEDDDDDDDDDEVRACTLARTLGRGIAPGTNDREE